MPRRKPTPFAPWESKAPNGIEKRYARMGNTQMCSDAMRKLSPSAFKIYWYMRLESAGKREFEFPHAKYASYMSKPTFFRCVRELEQAGFIQVVQHNKNLRIANLYRFVDGWKTQ